MPIVAGSHALHAYPATRASGLRPYRFTASSLTTTFAAAPSEMPDALPAVTVPVFSNTGRSLASESSEVCGRGCSSTVMVALGFLRSGTGTEVSSAVNAPAELAAAQRAWDCAA